MTEATAASEAPATSTSTDAAAKPRVLVVDDSRVIRIAARKILKDEFEPLEAGDGEEAWEILNKDTEIALVMSDLSMPYLDGMGLLQRLRDSDIERLRNMPVIIVTGAEDDDTAKTRAFAGGATDFITKPFDSVQLLAHTRSHVRLQKTTQELKETTTVLQENPATDPFTGLGNQKAFLERGQQGLAHVIRHRSDLALILLQVDNFDKLFVQHGKPVGGAILKAVSAAIQEEIRREDSAARISMARFGLVTCCANEDGARGLAARICARVARAALTGKDGQPLAITLSASVASPDLAGGETPRFETLLTQLVKRLERALAQGQSIVTDDAGAATPAATPVANAAAAPTDAIPGIDEALARLARGDMAGVRPHLRSLARSVLPLLTHWNQAEQRGLDSLLEQLRAAIEAEQN